VSEAVGQRARRFGSERLPDSDAPVLDEFYRPADAPAPGPWIARDGLGAVSVALGIGLAGAAQAVGVRLGVQPKRVLRWRFAGFELAGFGYAFAEVVEQLEAGALRRRSEVMVFGCGRRLPKQKEGKVEHFLEGLE
jgi:hypothetical protein